MTATKNALGVLAAGAALTLTATACGSGDTADSGDGLTPVSVGVLPITAVAPLYLGVEQGFFSERGLDVTIETGGGGATTVPRVVSGELDFAFGNVASLLIAREQGLPLTVVANGMTTTGDADTDYSALVVPADSDVTGPADLDGATVAIDNLNNIGDTSVRNSVRVAGGDPTDLDFIELAFPDMPGALDNGQVDAAWVVEPFLTVALEQGATEIAGNFVDLHPELSIATYFTSDELIAQHPDTVDAFTEAMNESLAYAQDHPEETTQTLTAYTEIDPDLFDQLRWPRFPARIDTEAVRTLADLMVTDGIIDADPDLETLIR
ncbi:ABC transporter substrate-binding protein [Nocardiopsis metallicus]|uniref:NitT/TauT family transport system substrate-binding protein n=1 Tax=Nocardiopsis metallicus TaxID=179819 RepID=A0A840WDW6_9ACTN|nr:ABC transporter substrate-binding protein [Nocardiopsis metallicus]MBB5490165.1 NitT/TauT family transport system substrate-binding protein [Nocardiopsis metallicus]